MRFSIFVSNHGKLDGIEDLISIISTVIIKRGHEVTVTETLDPDAITLIIDEFTDAISNREIIEFKRQNPNSGLVYVLTEFIEHRLFVTSFNFFGGIVEASVIAAMNVYFRNHREDFQSATIQHWLVAIFYSPLLVVYLFDHFLRNLIRNERLPLISRLHRTAYMLMRYLGLEKMIACADAVILSHQSIVDNINGIIENTPVLGTIHPEINFAEIERSLFLDKKLFIEITGSITPYRLKFIRRINIDILSLGIKNRFNPCKSIPFSTTAGQSIARGAYSLHPPQLKNWKYSSPTRIYRALQHEHNMPVLTKVFHQHPIEKLCLQFIGEKSLYEMYRYFKFPSELIDYLGPLTKEYMQIANMENDRILQAIMINYKNLKKNES
ncbi:hypothetical protein NP590_00110 [Methylomonas sp. SURF-2]|uniref:Glycosyltransferase subfamily 4-like N-terminal domain-containing protein n=1 Tax=Methylomonas subterranea TaxID=2952225 RepID=A0ABT1TB00_9GAMM|nr:hypothetical protein [Methylomonas sp. SURF-2]MCQ8102489.1 hypothetical protein [Methylomonas sp. SURF-2]